MSLPAKSLLTISLSAVLLAGCTSPNTSESSLLSPVQCQPTSNIEAGETSISSLTVLGTSIADAKFGTSAAEIVSYDSCTDKLYVVNAQAKKVDVLELDEQSKPNHSGTIDLQAAGKHANIQIGAANSVSTYQGLVAVAIENKDKQQPGIIGLFRSDTLELVTTYAAGSLPDMVSFSKDGRYIASANEGEPNADYSNDPVGSITLVDLGENPLTAKVTQIGFEAFNEGSERHPELSDNVRISGPNASVAQDLEPEYLTFAENGKLYVSLQENNAIAAIDVESASIDEIFGLGGKSWQSTQLDASNKDKALGKFKSYSKLEGLYMPDSIASYTVNGNTYIVTANEGDGREYGIETTQSQCDAKSFAWDGDDYTGTSDYNSKVDFCIAHTDETRGKGLQVEATHPLANALKDKSQLGRLKVVDDKTPLASSDTIQAFGSRSFSIWDENGTRVYDSGDEFANIAQLSQAEHFNSTNDSNQSGDDRSDDKGIEPEAIEVASINGRHYAFIGLERQGGIMTYDITNPAQALFVNYTNNRFYDQDVCTQVEDGECANGEYNAKAGDLGPESIKYFQRNQQHLLAVGNEVSGTTTVYRINL
ncbi:alkaline phosphatase [Vibrio sp. T187]|uniref:choice-of-anchor I family protein n=1 Tax=Vibrio TaxID=662 RepID=UPI0010CA06BF|nr:MULTISPECIES: choice-of-anchor I family protein [Vibrio]MBW3695976.1 alkaline phosphatase [Vibrio sp. T187]